ncbi:hypothetical protein [Streptomyces sp. NBC_01268]|uniref:hypothetical protein n=1 Tax=Streptomyces sp. NBC_01268 TaxID=2903806 RepID=UPI002E327906|nr:hypothetical protein [Streptomyces sp. NBC_01268]
MDRNEPEALRPPGYAEVSIVAASPDAARMVAGILRHSFVGGEQRSYPTPSGGTRLHLTVDTAHPAEPARSRLATSRPASGTGPHAEES